jgi:hypothetical protein
MSRDAQTIAAADGAVLNEIALTYDMGSGAQV